MSQVLSPLEAFTHLADDQMVQTILDEYRAFVDSKITVAEETGIIVEDTDLHPSLSKPHQRVAVRWALRMGRCLLAEWFGLGKTRQQLEIARIVTKVTGKRFLIMCPLGVRHTFYQEAEEMEMYVEYVTSNDEVFASDAMVFLTNYERVQSGDVTPLPFLGGGLSMDEGNYLRNLGSATTKQIMVEWKVIPYRYVATADPAPNRLKELLHYAEFLGVMDASQGVTRWFKRNPKKAHDVRLHPHHERDFWLWVATWALFLQKPSDLGFSDEGYQMPPVRIHWHQVDVDYARAWEQTDRNGQRRLLLDSALGVREAAAEKRATLADRLAKMLEIMEPDSERHWLLWHHLEDERRAIERVLPDASSVWGTQTLEAKEKLLVGFERGEYRILATKPEIAGSGCNFQKHCSAAIFLGVNYSFDELIQAIHRLVRYGQEETVDIHFIYAESESSVVATLKRKWKQHDRIVAEMGRIIRQFGMSHEAIRSGLRRSIGVMRDEQRGQRYLSINNDCVLETLGMPSNSVDLIHTSLPFGDQYEYVANYNDFGHNLGNKEFWQQMDFLIPSLYRVLKPGRIAAIHCKDRARVGKHSEYGIFNVEPFSDHVTTAFTKHGFVYVGRITIVTDVVKENAQTYRLGWTEMCKDGSKMGVGMPEYIQLFRKLPSDTANAYADDPVTHEKENYSRARWQTDAHSFWGSNGNRLLTPEEYAALDPKDAKWMWEQEQAGAVYDHERHVAVCEALDRAGKLPSSFMLISPQSKHPDVWSDVVYVRTLNTLQSQKRSENHVCPLPLDIVERVIERWSNEGEVVYDPFGGLSTVAVEAVRKGRCGIVVELNNEYFRAGLRYLNEAEIKSMSPTLFDYLTMLEGVAAEIQGELATAG